MAKQTSPTPDAPSSAGTSPATRSSATGSSATTSSSDRASSARSSANGTASSAKSSPNGKISSDKGATSSTAAAALSPDQIEAQIEKTRAHLASTIDELAVRAQPREIVRRQKESARAKLIDATHTPEGDLRVERLGAIAAAGVAVVVLLAVLHRRHHDG